ncbi:putative Kinase superfamily protein [Quillaja saponaria]|uniref:RING-type E3 ubiquitin transferase n=1 Tax=Quillaja saponaria TaxID=32244 RepID=A0AAD7P5K9_QUISA|nr:putative Kinase superfamily protein [Quillaja saponaria]
MVSYPVFCLPFIVLLFVQLGLSQNECIESKCGRGGPIVQFPFKIKDSKLDHCGYPGFDLSCTDEHETALELPAIPVKFFVRSIDYKSQVLEVYEPNNCFLRQLLGLNFSLSSPFEFQPNLLKNYSIFDCSSSEGNIGYEKSCSIIDTCYQLCAVLSDYDISSFEMPSCTKMGDISVSWIPYQRSLFLSWTNPDCSVCEAEGKNCRLKNNGTEGEIECFRIPKPIRGKSAKIIASSVVLGSFLLILVAVAVSHIYRSSKAREEYEVRIEQFLDDYRALKPTRYSFSDIKKITNQFKEKLGQGAYEIVFKGRLSNEIHVAVKILNHSRSSGEEFINEVGTMGKIHHVNIVRLG